MFCLSEVRECFLLTYMKRCTICAICANGTKSRKAFHIVVLSQNQLTIFIHARSTTIADYSGINYLLQASVFRQKLDIFRLYSFNTSHEKIPDLIVYLT